MMPHARHPTLYEINTRVRLRELGQTQGKGKGVGVTLDRVTDAELDRIKALGFDWVWLMGVWRTGPAGRRVSLSQPRWIEGFRRLLPDLTDDDVCGSPYAVAGYDVHPDFGGNDALLRFRQKLSDRGVRLMLDFVPNHTALDHPWVQAHPEFYVHGEESDLAAQPGNFCRVGTPRGPVILAHGRDPYFPGWADTLQLNYRHPALREAMIGELGRIAGMCDGVRCDMAMLLLPDVFSRTWHKLSQPRDGSAPNDAPFWPDAITRARSAHPEFVFLAEAYWDLEWALQQQGFDFTYDKRLYDHLHSRNSEQVRGHLHADLDFQAKSVRFLENHDEERAASAFPPGVHQAAATVAFLVPGMRLFFDGQLEGRKARHSVHLARRPSETVDLDLQAFYLRLLECLRRRELRAGSWKLLDCRAAWEENPTWSRFIAFSWEGPTARRMLIAVNYGPTQGQCLLSLPFTSLRGRD